MTEQELCTIAVVVRDRFSTTEACFQNLLDHTPAFCRFLAVIGGAPKAVQKRLSDRFGKKIEMLFEENLLNPAQSRNIGLRSSKTRLTVLMDNDVHVRSGWLEPLVRCQKETGAAMVVPLILETPTRVHTAGNDLFVTHKNGRAFGQKVLRYAKMTYFEDGNMKRTPTDYGELHCQLVETEVALRLNVFDERLMEAGEVDSGLLWAQAGHSMWFEPSSVVFYDFPGKIAHAEDIRPFKFKWDMRTIQKGYEHFEKKWDFDITECGNWQKFNIVINDKLGLLSRMFPCQFSIFLDNVFINLRGCLNWPAALWQRFKSWVYGYYEWK